MPSAPGSVPASSGRPDPLFCSPFAVTRTFSLDRRATYLQAVDWRLLTLMSFFFSEAGIHYTNIAYCRRGRRHTYSHSENVILTKM